MEVDENRSKYGTLYKGKTYHFCSPGCRAEFEKDPEKYSQMVQEIGGTGEPSGKCH